VGAATQDGSRCAFAASGPEVDLWSPGCPVEAAFPDGTVAWASGSSESSVFVAGVLAQLRQLSSGSTVDQAERALINSAQVSSAGPRLDVGAAFLAAGLAGQLVTGHVTAPQFAPSSDASVPKPSASNGPFAGQEMTVLSSERDIANAAVVPPLSSGQLRVRLPMPTLRSIRLRRHVLSMSFKNKPRSVEAQVQIYARTTGRAFPALLRTLRVIDDRFRTQVAGAVSQVSITYRDPQRTRDPSVLLNLHSVR